ncbi:PAS domain-containing protein [Halosimplex sp. TS25]|uniref:PAS domain-containing protein n=1 Tax=Halosimplex rarum TaxID=3396619 RepID=UPI0039EA202F
MSERFESRRDAGDPLVSAVLAAVDDPAAVCDPTGRVLDWNGAFADRVDGVGDLGDASFADLVDCASDPLARAVETSEETIGSGPLASTGREVTVAVRPVEREGSVSAVVATVSEPPEPFEDDRALYEASVDAAADSVYVVDPSYRIRVASEGFTRFTGVPTDAIEGRDVACLRELGIVDEGAFHEGMRALRAMFAGESDDERVTAEVALDDGPGVVENRMRPIERDGEVVAVVNAVRDVTEREWRREALATNRERLSTILDDLPVLMVVVDGEERVEHCQGMDFDAFDCDRSDLLDEPIEAFEPTCPDVVAGFRRALDGETASATETINDRTYTVCIEPLSEPVSEAGAEPVGAAGDSAGESTGAIAVAMDVTDRTRREEALHTREQELRAVIDSSADPIAMQDLDGRFQVVNEAMLAALETDRERVVGSRHEDLFPDAFAQRVEAHRRAVLETERARVVEESPPADDEQAVIQLTLAPYHGPDCEVQGTVSIARDITELERQRDELETLTEIQELVQESMRALTGATTSDAIQETVCDRLAESEFYEFAWIGQRRPGERELQPAYSAGAVGDYLDSVTVNVDAGDNGNGPASRAYRTGDIQVVHDVHSDPDFEPWREAAVENGFESVAAVPLTHGSTTHGLLGVYADRPNAFSQRELAGFETLGEVVGFALSAAQYRRLVEADSVLELEFEVRGETPFNEASREHDCRFEIEHAVRTGDDRVVNYLTVEGADPAVGESVARSLSNLEALRRLDGDDGPHYEMTLTDSVFQYLADVGARGERGVVEDGVGHMHVEAPADADVRKITDAIDERFPTVDLVAKREKRRADAPWWHSHGDIGTRLTDRQRAVLKTAYYNGYYEWPRDADSEDLADSLDIASTTLLQHLRKGHRRILEAMFET